MTRYKPNSHHRRVIIDLSWPLGESVNAGIDKHTYLGSDFELTFPSIDDITNELKCLGRGALLYKVDVSHAFLRHVPPIRDATWELDLPAAQRRGALRHAQKRFQYD